jgi:septum formation protein
MRAGPLLTLASASPRRRDLLAGLDVAVVVQPSRVDEAAVAAPDEPRALVRALATAKAGEVFVRRRTPLVLGADTLVALDGDVLGKPADAVAAEAMLRRLAGRTHAVHTGLALLSERAAVAPGWEARLGALAERGRPLDCLGWVAAAGRLSVQAVVTTAVTFRPLDAVTIRAYVATGEPLDKAGAYGIQGRGGRLVAGLDGCYTNVVGLPLCAAAALLAALTGRVLACPAHSGCRFGGKAACFCGA